MKWMQIVGFAVLTVAILGCDQVAKKIHFGDDPAEHAKKRLDFVLQTIQEEGTQSSTKMQTAVCRWEEDEPLIDRDLIEPAYDAFNQWRKQADILPTLGSFEINPEFRVSGQDDPADTFYFHVKVNGGWRWVRVPPKGRITWAQ